MNKTAGSAKIVVWWEVATSSAMNKKLRPARCAEGIVRW